MRLDVEPDLFYGDVADESMEMRHGPPTPYIRTPSRMPLVLTLACPSARGRFKHDQNKCWGRVC
eukprot:147657-Pyramimonas_sp.AAC.1